MSTGCARGAGALAAVALALALPAAAPAAISSTTTLAAIGSGSYLLTVNNTGTETIGGLTVEAANTTSVASDANCVRIGVAGFLCDSPIPVGASLRVCYSGSAPTYVRPGAGADVPPTYAPATTCPFAGFTPGTPAPAPTPTPTPTPAPTPSTPTTTTPGSTTPAKTTPTKAVKWKRARCVSTYKSWKTTHKRATRKQKNAQQRKLQKLYGCSLSAFK